MCFRNALKMIKVLCFIRRDEKKKNRFVFGRSLTLLPQPLPANSQTAPIPSQTFAYNNTPQSFTKRLILIKINNLIFQSIILPALGVAPFAVPMENSVFSKHIKLVQRPHYLWKHFHQLCILIALHLYFVHQLHLHFPVAAERVQKRCPCLHLYHHHTNNNKALTPKTIFQQQL